MVPTSCASMSTMSREKFSLTTMRSTVMCCGVRWQRVCGHDPAALAQKMRERDEVGASGIARTHRDDWEQRAVGDQLEAVDRGELGRERLRVGER